MNLEEKYNMVRSALLGVVGIQDDKAQLIALLGEVRKQSNQGSQEDQETARVSAVALVALLQTHEG